MRKVNKLIQTSPPWTTYDKDAFSQDKDIQTSPQENILHDTLLPALCFLYSACKEIQGKPNASKTQLGCGRVCVAQMVDHLPGMPKALGFIFSTRETGQSNSHS